MTGSSKTSDTATGQALAMLSAFASVGTRAFNKTILDINGSEVEGLYRGNRSLEELRRTIARDLQDAERNQHSVVIRPLFKTPLLIQLDDLDATKTEQTTPLVFLVIRASAGKDGKGNYQAWVAVKDAPAEEAAAKDFVAASRKPVTPTAPPAAIQSAAWPILPGAAQRLNGASVLKRPQAI